jgi:hypothetical protein
MFDLYKLQYVSHGHFTSMKGMSHTCFSTEHDWDVQPQVKPKIETNALKYGFTWYHYKMSFKQSNHEIHGN